MNVEVLSSPGAPAPSPNEVAAILAVLAPDEPERGEPQKTVSRWRLAGRNYGDHEGDSSS